MSNDIYQKRSGPVNKGGQMKVIRRKVRQPARPGTPCGSSHRNSNGARVRSQLPDAHLSLLARKNNW
ncbi:MAG TPA: hypothetical protein VGF67_31175 [Ktedonobacteraceae bacterium]